MKYLDEVQDILLDFISLPIVCKMQSTNKRKKIEHKNKNVEIYSYLIIVI